MTHYSGQIPIKCSGPCQLFYHPKCIPTNDSSNDSSIAQKVQSDVITDDVITFTCRYCQAENWECFICHNNHNDKDNDNPIIKCADSSCGRHYHKYDSYNDSPDD